MAQGIPTGQSCYNCRYWATAGSSSPYGECVYSAPVPQQVAAIDRTDYFTYWPRTYSSAWCTQWKTSTSS